MFHVTADVIIKEQLQSVKQKEFEKCTMHCRVKNPKKLPVKWFKNGALIDPDADPARVTISSDEEGLQQLEISELQMEDAAEYKCQIGDRDTSGKLTVEEGKNFTFILLNF